MTSGIETSRWVGGFLRFCGRGGRVSAGGSLTYTTPLRYEARLVDRRSTCARRERRETFCATMCTCETESDRQRICSHLDAHAHGKGLDGRTHIKVGATATRHHVISRTLTLFDAWRQISPCLSQYCPKRSPWRALTFVGAGLRFLRPLVRPSTRHNRGGRTSPNGAALGELDAPANRKNR